MIVIIKWAAIVLLAIGVLVIGYFLWFFISLFKGVKKFESDNPPPEGVMPLLAFGNILAGLNAVKTLKIEEDKEETIADLKNYWGITGRKSTIEMFDWMFDEGHRTQYKAYFEAIISGDKKALEQVIYSQWGGDEDEDNNESVTYEVNAAFAQFKLYKRKLRRLGFSNKKIAACNSINAWDYDRAAATARYALHVGYISEAECISYLGKVAGLAQKEFVSWREYVLSFLMGRAICYNASSLNLLCFSIKRRFLMKKSLWNLYPLQKIQWTEADYNLPDIEEYPKRSLQVELLFVKAEKLVDAYNKTEDETLMQKALKCYIMLITLTLREELFEDYDFALEMYMVQAELLGNQYINLLRFKEAVTVFRKMKTVALTVADDKQRHKYLDTAIDGVNHVGTAYGESGYQDEALELFLEAMNDYWQLSDAVPECLNQVAMLQSNIGYLYILNSDYDKAHDILHKALGTYNYIRKNIPDKFTPDMEGDVYTNLGLLSMHLDEYKQAVEALAKACRRYRKALSMVASESKNEVQAGYATALSNLGLAYINLRRRFPAMFALRKSLKIRCRLLQQCPNEKEYYSDLSDCYLNIGNLYTMFLMFGRSTKYFEKAIRLREYLADADPDRYLQSLADAYNNWIIVSEARPVYSVKKRNQLTILNYCEKKLVAFARLKENEQDVSTHDIAETNALAGKLSMKTEQFAKAQNYLMDALLQYHEVENDLDFDHWFKMMESMSMIIVLFNDVREDKKNAIVMLKNLSKRYQHAPEEFRRKAGKIEKSIKHFTTYLISDGDSVS